MRQRGLVAALGTIVWCLCRAGAIAAASAPPTPTSVLPPPATSGGQTYHSSLAPYAVQSPWPGHPVLDWGLPFDLFEGGHATITVQAEPNTHALDSRGAEQQLCATIVRWGMTPVVLRRLAIAGQQRIALLSFSGLDGVFVAVTFVAARRVWILQLSSTYAQQAQDRPLLGRFLDSFRRETRLAGTLRTETRLRGGAETGQPA